MFWQDFRIELQLVFPGTLRREEVAVESTRRKRRREKYKDERGEDKRRGNSAVYSVSRAKTFRSTAVNLEIVVGIISFDSLTTGERSSQLSRAFAVGGTGTEGKCSERC